MLVCTDYEVVDAISRSQLVEQVRQMVKDGWFPQGGITVSYDAGNDAHFHQAMIRAVMPFLPQPEQSAI